MEKIVKIDEKDVAFKNSASFFLRYREYFGSDGLKDLQRISKMTEDGALEGMLIMQQILWCMAKIANPKIPPVIDWLDSFEEFPTVSIFEEVQDLFLNMMKVENDKGKSQKNK